MKRIALLTPLLFLPVMGCTQARPPDTRIGDLGTAPETIRSSNYPPPPGQTKPTPATDRATARQQAEQQLAGLDHDLQVLKDRAKHASADVQAKLQPTIDGLEKQTAATRARLAELRDQSTEAWQAAQPALNRALGDLREAYRKASAKFSPK